MHAEDDCHLRLEGAAVDGLQHLLSLHKQTVRDGLALCVLSEFNEKCRSVDEFGGIGIDSDFFSLRVETFLV